MHDDDDASAAKLISNNIMCYAIFVIYLYVLTQYSAGTIYTRVEENPWGWPRGPTVGALQLRCCVCCGWRNPAWKVCEDIDYFSISYS
jgi:hypothetical protein